MQKKTSNTFNSDLIKKAIEQSKPIEEEIKNEDLCRNDFLKQYASLHNRISTPLKAFKVTFKGLEDLWYISFKENRNKAIWEAVKYYQESFHPSFLCENMLYQARVKRIKELDQYAKNGKVPIADLLKVLKIEIPCSACGKRKFSYKSYENKSCFITEEFDLNPHTKGVILCYDCFQKYMGKK